MPGRPLRRQRMQAIDTLTDEQASDLAYAVVQKLSKQEALTLLFATLRRAQEPLTNDRVRQLSTADRMAIAHAVASEPDTARAAIATHAHRPEVERALGINRTPRQRHR